MVVEGQEEANTTSTKNSDMTNLLSKKITKLKNTINNQTFMRSKSNSVAQGLKVQ